LYSTPSLAARAALQLQAVGKAVRPGQPIKLLHTLGEPGVHAWDTTPLPTNTQLDTSIYIKLLLRAAETIVQPFGVSPDTLKCWVLEDARYTTSSSLPLLPVYSTSLLTRVNTPK
jgi:hypothetical protein